MDEIEKLKARIEELEDVLLELAPFGGCHEVITTATLAGKNDEDCLRKGQFFKRDTLYTNKFVYRRVAKLIEPKLRANGYGYIFDVN